MFSLLKRAKGFLSSLMDRSVGEKRFVSLKPSTRGIVYIEEKDYYVPMSNMVKTTYRKDTVENSEDFLKISFF